MIYILFSLLIGSLISLFLIAPSEYYFMLLSLPIIGIILIVIFKKTIKKPSRYILISLPIFILLSYFVTSLVVFNEKNIKIVDVKPESLSEDKKAVIFYTDGEMEKYLPYFAGRRLSKTSYFLKPIESFKIKKAYDHIELSRKNIELIKIARDFRESLLKNSPNLFYISYSDYTPSLNESINSALIDGCKNISIMNFSNNKYNNENLEKIKKDLKVHNVNINISTPILKNLKMDYILKQIPSDLSKFQGALILSNDPPNNIKSEIQRLGINESLIHINNNITKGLSSLNSTSPSLKNILIINLIDFENGIFEKYTIPEEIEKYKDINFNVVNPLKYNDDFLEIIVNEYKTIKP